MFSVHICYIFLPRVCAQVCSEILVNKTSITLRMVSSSTFYKWRQRTEIRTQHTSGRGPSQMPPPRQPAQHGIFGGIRR